MFERWENADRRTLMRLAIAAVVGLVIFGAIMGAVRQAGWNEGFLVGLLAGDGDSQALAPYLAYRTGAGGWHSGPGLVGGAFKFLFFGFLFVMLMKAIGFWRWRMHGGHPWHHHGPWQPGPQSQPGPGGGSPQPDQPSSPQPQNTTWINV